MSTPETASVAGSWTPDGEVLALPSEDALLGAIATIYDPEIPVNIYELGLIYAVDISDAGAVKVEMTLTAPGCPSAQELPVQVRDALDGRARRHFRRCRDRMGSALGSKPHDRRGAARLEHVLIRRISWATSKPLHARNALCRR